MANGANRCFHCKSALMDALAPLARLAGARVALGVNLDDLSDHRPGQAAAAARGAISPLCEAGFTKADVRAGSSLLGLGTADKPAAACLASRVAYGDPVTAELMLTGAATARAPVPPPGTPTSSRSCSAPSRHDPLQHARRPGCAGPAGDQPR